MSPRRFVWPFDTEATPATDEVEAAWREYRAVRSETARETLLRRYLPLVRAKAVRLARTLPWSVETDDLISAGILGLLAAFDAFIPTMHADFSTYATIRVRGAMADFLREIDPIRRRTRRQLRRLTTAVSALERELGEAPSASQAAERLGLSVERYEALRLQAAASIPTSLEGLEADPGVSGSGTPRPRVPDHSTEDGLASVLRTERCRGVQAWVSQLPTAQQLVLRLRYTDELNFREIAMLMDVSESRVTQLHGVALTTLAGLAGGTSARLTDHRRRRRASTSLLPV